MTTTGQLFEKMMATFPPPVVAGGWQAKCLACRVLVFLGSHDGPLDNVDDGQAEFRGDVGLSSKV